MTKKPIALITGINGQDGSYLAENLLARGYCVHGIVRQESFEAGGPRMVNIEHLLDDIQLHVGSIHNHLFVDRMIETIMPDECYHLASPSFVSQSFQGDSNVLYSHFQSTHMFLESMKEKKPDGKFYFAGSSEMFGDADVSPQDEQTAFKPRTLYGIGKLSAYHLVNHYRKVHQLFACTGILYNHESPRRGFAFVTRKITHQVAKIHLGLASHLELGNLQARRDWGYAPEYVDAMTRILAHDEPQDFVIATGKTHSVQNLVDCAFDVVGLMASDYISTNETLIRAEPANPLVGNAYKAKKLLGFEPKKPFEDIIKEMVHADVALLEQALV